MPFIAHRAPWLRRLAPLLPLLLAACQTTTPAPEPAPPPPPPVVPLATHTFTFEPGKDEVVGELQITHAHYEDTLSDIARRFNVGYDEIIRANPDVDPWLPKEGTEVVLPTRFVLPRADYKGIVINLPAQRLFYFPPRKRGEPQTVITHPIGIGLVGWSTPVGTTKITTKLADPWWYPPASVRKKHAAEGNPLPGRVPPGPDNPLGRHAMLLGWKSYLIHGTNKPAGVGMRASHGCVRMYPEDIAKLFADLPVGTPVTVVNQPLLYGWQDGSLFLQAYPVLEDYDSPKPGDDKLLERALARGDEESTPRVDRDLVATLAEDRRGIAVPVSARQLTLARHLAGVTRVENRLPEQANWNGKD